MLHKLRKLVLVLIMVVAIVSPFMQLDSWDNFPTSTDDIELQITFNLCIIGMFLVFAGIMKLLPAMFLSRFQIPAMASPLAEFDLVVEPKSVLASCFTPLRI